MSQSLAEAKALIQRELFKRFPLEFLRQACFTIDEHDAEHPIKKFPVKAYTPIIVKEFIENKRLFVAKSRQIMATWHFAALALWQAMFFPYQKVFIISKKENDAFELVKRIRHIYSALPKWLQALCPLDRKLRDQPQGYCYFANGSEIRGLPQGPDQIRMYTASLILIDEASFLDLLEETYGACVPAVAGGGKLIVFSSAGSSYFGSLVEIKDKVNFGQELQRGVYKKLNSQGIVVLTIHYSADDEKDVSTEVGRKFQEEMMKDYPGGRASPKYRKEMEIDFTVGSGQPVFEYLPSIEDSIKFDLSKLSPQLLATAKFYGGADWGLNKNNSAATVVMEDVDGRFYEVWEWAKTNVTPQEYSEAWHSCPFFSRLEWIAADPTMWNENQSRKEGYTSFARILEEEMPEHLKLKLIPAHGRSDIAAITRLDAFWKQAPLRYLISHTCPQGWRELVNLRYMPTLDSKNSSEKIVDKDNHNWDCRKYIILSHPQSGSFIAEAKVGTLGYLNDIADQARMIANETGGDYQEIFNSLYESV
jgi:hypothetical protein